MGNGYNHHHFQYQRNLNNFHKSTFLPILCSRTSIKDMALPTLEDRFPPFSKDPLSPKIGCMGQVKTNNNKIIRFPTTSYHNNINNKLPSTTKSSGSRNNNVKYFKLKRIFSSMSIIAINNNSNNITSSAESSCRRRRRRRIRREVTKEREVLINIAEMDPPLPVIKRVPKPSFADCEGDENKNNIWKRRSNGRTLQSLELQNIKNPRDHQVEIQTV